MKTKRKKISVQVWLEPEQASALRALSNRTRIPFAAYIREGADMVLAKYRAKPKGRTR